MPSLSSSRSQISLMPSPSVSRFPEVDASHSSPQALVSLASVTAAVVACGLPATVGTP